MTTISDIIFPGFWQKELDAAKPYSVFELPSGIIHEKLIIRTPGLRIIGQGAEHTVISWDDYANKMDKNGIVYNTFRTWTVAVCAENVHMSGLSIENTARSPAQKGQEVALSVCADGFSMENCSLRSTQDTLFLGALPKDLQKRYEDFLPIELRCPGPYRQSFSRCRIEGSVDFIFGCGVAEFRDCEIRSVYDGRAVGYVSAPAHEPEQSSGFTFTRCIFSCEEAVPSGSIYLARPWRDYGMSSFIDCTYDRHICSSGFDKWNDTRRDLTARFYEYPKQNGRVDWLR